MSGLNRKDIEILRYYADAGNRELYWNYLAQKEGADGYGLLALGVVRNDNLPGQVANAYAQSQASSQHDRDPRFQNRVLTEREWEAFGQTLLHRDLELRERWMDAGKPDLALNLPGRDVQDAHDKAFIQHRLDPNCWTPRVLLEATERKLGAEAAESVWKEMLNNGAGGLQRAWNTRGHAYDAMSWGEATMYIGKLGLYEYAMMNQALPASDPNIIGVRSAYHMYDEKNGNWYLIPEAGIPLQQRNAHVLDSLNDAREVRRERAELATQFHPDDPYRQRMETPKVVQNDAPISGQETRLAGLNPGDTYYPLYHQVREHVAGLDARHGRSFDETSERLTASLAALAAENRIDRADHVVFSSATQEFAAGRNVFVVQGDLNDPAHRRAAMSTQEAVQTPVEQSLQRLEVASADRQQALAQSQQQEVDQQARENPAIRMG